MYFCRANKAEQYLYLLLPIHHSDRGVQYASSEYVRILRNHGIRISMTESGDPKENAQAERINMMTPAEAALCEGVLEKWWVSYREKAVRAILEKQDLENGENNISLSAVQGSPSGLRPPVNPGTR